MHKNKLTQILIIILFSFVVLMAISITLYNFYIDDFVNLTTSELYASLFLGFRVDMIIIFIFSTIFMQATNRRSYRVDAVSSLTKFDKDINERFVYFYAGNLIGLITDNGFIKYNFKNIVEKFGTEENIQKMKKLLFSVDTAEAQLLEKNRWAK